MTFQTAKPGMVICCDGNPMEVITKSAGFKIQLAKYPIRKQGATLIDTIWLYEEQFDAAGYVEWKK